MVSSPRKQSQIPVFGSIEEQAEFWDTHDSTDFEDEFEPVEFEISPDFHSRFVVDVDFDRETWNRLRDFARRHDVRLADLTRAWVLEGFARDAEGDVLPASLRPDA